MKCIKGRVKRNQNSGKYEHDICKDLLQSYCEKPQLRLVLYVQYITPSLEKRAVCMIFGCIPSIR